MSRARIYPLANRTAQWFEDKYTRATMAVIEKVLLHSTETSGWPGYNNGSDAPTLTYNPWLAAGQRWRQHNYLDTSARALRDPSGTLVRENRDGVVQIEIVAYCDPKLYKRYGHGVNALPDHFYEDIGAFLAFMHTEASLLLARAPEWDTFPPSDSIRMSGAEYDAFKGVLGHQHASGNTHGDPGLTNAQVDRILNVAKRIIGAPTQNVDKPPTKEDDMPYTEQQLESFAGVGVHGQKLGRSNVTIGQAIDTTRKDAAAARAMLASLSVQVTGLTAAVKALSEQKGVDPAAVIAAVSGAAEKALEDVKITLAVEDDGKESTQA